MSADWGMETSAEERDARRACDAWLDRFFAHYYARRPVNATFIGIHEHDHALPDFTPAGIAGQLAEMRDLRAQVPAGPLAALNSARRHDLLLADGFLELQIMEAELPQFHRGNPALYTGEAVFSVLALFLQDAEPLGERVAAAIARVLAVPAFLAQARRNVDEAPVAWTEQAAREARAAVAYFGDGLPRLAHERQVRDARFLDAAGIARDAFAEHAAWLDESLRLRPTSEVACGRAAFDRYLERGHMLPAEQDASWLANYAARAMADARGELEARAAARDPARSWQEQLAELADHHPPLAGYLKSYPRVWEAARAAAIAADLLTWPDYPIQFVPIPGTDREAAAGLYYLFYRCPPPFGRPEIHRYLVPPIDDAMSPEEQERRLRATNDEVIALNHVVHHGGLGHHVQNWHAFRTASRIGQIAGVDCASRIALFCGGTLVEGWACYATDLMEEIGFLTPLQSLAQQQSRLRMAARAVADVGLHTGALSLDETAAFYEREAGMTAAAARTEAVKNSMFPGAAMMYLVGTNAIHDLRGEMAARQGSAFSLRAFHDGFLRFGAIPVSLIAEEMLQPPA